MNVRRVCGPKGRRPEEQQPGGHSSGGETSHHGLKCGFAIHLSPENVAYTHRDYQITDRDSLLVYVIYFPNDTHTTGSVNQLKNK